MPTRPRYPISDFIHEALSERGLIDVYHARPPSVSEHQMN
jgi:hypothetical protein